MLLPLLKSDLYEVMVSCVKGDLHVCNPSFHDNKFAVAVVLASGGYPGSYKKGMTINGLEDCKVSFVADFEIISLSFYEILYVFRMKRQYIVYLICMTFKF